jgi:hypothetical protein
MKVIKRMSSPLKQHMFQIIMDCLFFVIACVLN